MGFGATNTRGFTVCPMQYAHGCVIQGQFWPSGIVVAGSVCMCVCLSVCQSRACPLDNSWPIQARITTFGPNVQNTLVKVIVLRGNGPWHSRSNITLKIKIYQILIFKFFCAITRHPFKLGSPNLDQSCKPTWLWSLLFWCSIPRPLHGPECFTVSTFLRSILI